MKRNFSAIIVDDEPLARKLTREYLQDFPEIRIAGECRNGRQAVKAINEHKPDLVFLDIRMPGMDGFEVLEHLETIPHIVFVTAYGDYALRAFEVNAVDYLLKPFDRKRFSHAVQRVLDRGAHAAREMERILHLMQQAREPDVYPQRIFVRVGKKILSIQLKDIVWIAADGDYTQLHTSSGAHLCNLRLHALEEKLDPTRFLRVHRSTIVAADSIEQLTGDGEGGFFALLKDRTRVKVSRTYAAKLRKNVW